MKILHIGPVKPGRVATGPSHSIRGLVTAQAEIGLEVGLLSSVPLQKGQLPRELPGVRVICNQFKCHRNPWVAPENCLRKIVDEFGKPDLINFHSTYIPLQTALARKFRKQGWPYIITPRGGMTYLAQNFKGAKKKVANVLCFRSYVKNAAAIHALCQIEAQEIDKLFETKKIFIVPNGVEDYLLQAPERITSAHLGSFRDNCDLMLGFVGRIDIYHKGLDLLLKAMALLKKKVDVFKTKLFVIGPFYTKHDERTFLSAIKSLGLNNSVKVLGPKYDEEKLSYFLACDVFVHTSRFEGMPMAVLEAMALGCPCLVTPGTNVGDLVREAGGWQCEPEPESIARAIKSVYHQKDSLKVLGQQSCKLIQSRFTWRRVAQQLFEEYSKIITTR